MLGIFRKYLFDRSNNQHGSISIAVAVTLISLLGAVVYYEVPEAIDRYSQSLHRLRDGNPTNEDLTALRDTLDASRNAAGGLPIPNPTNITTFAEDSLAIWLFQALGISLDIAMAEPPAPLASNTTQSGGCTMTLSSSMVRPGDIITATLTTPIPLHNAIGNISCTLGAVGFGIPVPGGTSPVSIPDNIEADTLTVKCYVIAAAGGDTICSPEVIVQIITTNILLDSDVTFHGDLFSSAREQAPLETLVDGVFVPNRRTWDSGTVSWADPTAYITFDLGGIFDISSFIAQVDDNDAYILSYWNIDSNSWQLAWDIPNYDDIGWGMTTRPNPKNNTEAYSLGRTITTNALKLQSGTGAGAYSVSELQAFGFEVSGK